MDHYDYWCSFMEGGSPPFVDIPQAGFYRRKMGRGGGWRPVAIWPENGELVCLDGDQKTEPWRVWGTAGANPTTEKAYRDKCAGIPYSDEYTTVSGDTSTEVSALPLVTPKRRQSRGDTNA